MRLVRLALIVTIISGLLAGCSLAPSTTKRPVIHVVAVTYPGGAPPSVLALYQAALEITKQQNTEYELNVSIVSPTQEEMMNQKIDPTGPTAPPTVTALEQALGQDPPPDIVLFASSLEFSAALERDLLLPIDSYVNNDRSQGVDDYFPGALEAVTDGGQIYALPIGMVVTMLQYDKRLFDEAGAEVPGSTWNWTTLVSSAQRLTSVQDPEPVWGLSSMDPGLLFAFIWQNGGEILSADGKRSLLGEPQAIEAIKFFHSLIFKQKVAPSLNDEQGGKPFPGRGGITVRPGVAGDVPPMLGPGGRIAMQPYPLGFFGGFDQWAIGGADRPVRLTEFPKGRVQATQVQVDLMMAMTTRVANPQLAYQAMTTLAAEVQKEGGIPARRSLAKNLKQAYPSLLDEELQAITNSLEYGRAIPLVGQDRWMPLFHEKLMMPLLTSDKDPDEAIKEAVQAIDEALNQ